MARVDPAHASWCVSCPIPTWSAAAGTGGKRRYFGQKLVPGQGQGDELVGVGALAKQVGLSDARWYQAAVAVGVVARQRDGVF